MDKSYGEGEDSESWCWSYFTKTKDSLAPLCKLCDPSKIIRKSLGSTWALKVHLSRIHRIDEEKHTKRKIDEKHHRTEPQSEDDDDDDAAVDKNGSSPPKKKARQEKFENNVVNLIATAHLSIATVNNPGFLKLVHDLNSSIKVPDRHILSSREIPRVVSIYL